MADREDEPASWERFEIDAERPVAVLADLHANGEALDAVLADLDARGVDQAVVLGDVVGYGASPVRVVHAIRERGWPVLRGNHEDMFVDFAFVDSRGLLKERARRALEWTREVVDAEIAEWIASLPAAARVGRDGLAVHGSLVDPTHCYAYIYDLSLDLNLRRLEEWDAETGAVPEGALIFHGHTHWPRLYRVEGSDWREDPLPPGETIRLEAGSRFFVNPGSVGSPRDGDPRAAYLLWHPGARTVELRRVVYDVEAAAARIREAGYADEVADRLVSAR